MTITLRSTKGSALTYAEMDANFQTISDLSGGTIAITPNIDGGTIDNSVIGAETAVNGNFTAVNATGITVANTSDNTTAPIIHLNKKRVSNIVQSGDDLGDIYFRGFDGVQYINAARIRGESDGTPGVNDMPGRITFHTCADGSASLTERMRIDSAGRLGIGDTSPSPIFVSVLGDITGSVQSPFANFDATVKSDVTTAASVIRSNPSTEAASFTLTTLNHFIAAQGTIGAGSTVTNQIGYRVESTLTGATNNYGFYGNIASGANRYNFYAAGTAANSFSGDVTIHGDGKLGYTTGSGGAVTQGTNRTTGVTLNKTNGAITLVSAAGTATWQTFTVTNSTVAATDTVHICQKSGTDLNMVHITNVADGSFKVSFATTGGTTTEQPVFNFAVIKGVAS